MAGLQPTRAGEDGGAGLAGPVLILSIVYWLVAAYVAFSAYQVAYQDQYQRLTHLTELRLITGDGRLDRNRAKVLAAEADTNRLCWDAHPAPADHVGMWLPPDCDVYLPADATADAADAVWAAAHPGSANAEGWNAAGGPLLIWALIYVGLTAVAAVIWRVALLFAPRTFR